MRTTISIDDDVLTAVRDEARRERRTIGEVLSDLARQALVGTPRPGVDPARARHGFSPLPHRGPAVSNALIDRLREDDGG
ncbi:antitoxin [Geodermatophilus sp. SYSU D01176]